MRESVKELLDNPTVHVFVVVLGAAGTIMGIIAAVHVVLYKRDTRAAVGWVGVIIINPLIGAVLYTAFGVNRIHRKARRKFKAASPQEPSSFAHAPASDDCIAQTLGPAGHLKPLIHLMENLTERPLLDGNHIKPLFDGPSTYKRMLQAIDHAERSVAMCSYIFDNDAAGARFHDALKNAVDRGVQVRVLIDDVGSRYSFPTIVRRFRRSGVPVALFMPTLVPWMFHYSNLRNHRKILVVDGRIGFTGGMNIRGGYLHQPEDRHCIADLHFRLEGPVVSHLQEVFAVDWEFSTQEQLEGEPWFGPVAPAGETLARGVSDGPDDDFDKMRMAILGAIDCAQHSLTIVTPYFLPDDSLITSLNVAALRGVQVNIVLPEKNNLALVQWACSAMLWQLLQRGCRIWLSPPPFDHTKLMLVDGAWTLLGSTNWDPRSLRLNFEFNVECYDRQLAARLADAVAEKMKQCREVTLAEMDARHLLTKLRDGVARLASPYL